MTGAGRAKRRPSAHAVREIRRRHAAAAIVKRRHARAQAAQAEMGEVMHALMHPKVRSTHETTPPEAPVAETTHAMADAVAADAVAADAVTAVTNAVSAVSAVSAMAPVAPMAAMAAMAPSTTGQTQQQVHGGFTAHVVVDQGRARPKLLARKGQSEIGFMPQTGGGLDLGDQITHCIIRGYPHRQG